MILLFATPLSLDAEMFFNLFPSRSIVNFVLFWGLVHIWIGACKKQLKYDKLRKNAFPIVFGIAVFIAIISEAVIYGFNTMVPFNYWSLMFDMLGALFGIASFRLLYASCY